MNFSLITVQKKREKKIDGFWLQHCCGTTLEDAVKRAIATKEVNGNKITIAVVPYTMASYIGDEEALAIV